MNETMILLGTIVALIAQGITIYTAITGSFRRVLNETLQAHDRDINAHKDLFSMTNLERRSPATRGRKP